MFTASIVLVSMLLTEPANAKKAAGNEWDPEAAKALDAKVRAMMSEFDKGNVEPFVSNLDTVTTAWDIGVKGDPLAATTPEDSRKMLESFAKWVKEDGVMVKTTVNRTDCHSTAMFGFCALEYDQTYTAKSGEMMANQKFRATIISRKVDGEWRWAHWHASLREGTMMAQPAPAAVP